VELLQSSSEVDPHVFVTRARLDIAVKVRLFRQLKWGGDVRALTVYREHIAQRTGGHEKRSWKRSVDDYLFGAREMRGAMERRGFLSAYPVQTGNNLNLMDGAHRIACAIVLGCNVHVQVKDKPGNAAPWDEAFMKRGGMAEADIAETLEYQERLEHEARRRIG
jgi:hypothetical protein